MSLPYYFNLAPNYDATLTPRVMTRRGLQIIGQARYLFPNSAGEADAELLPDRITGTNRYALSWKHNQNFVSCLGSQVTSTSKRYPTTPTLPICPIGGGDVADGAAAGGGVRVQPRAVFLADPDPEVPDAPGSANPITPPYFREPQLLMTMSPVAWNGLDFAASGEFVRFRQPALVSGRPNRAVPDVTWSQRGNAWFFNARTGLHMTHYDLDSRHARNEFVYLDCVLPISSVDSGLVFERDANWFGKAFMQTLEPRAYYVYIPLSQPGPDTGIRHGDRRVQFFAALHRKPLSRHRSHRRRESADAGRASRGCSIRRPARRGCASRSGSAIIFRPSGDADRGAAHAQHLGHVAGGGGAVVGRVVGCRRTPIQH